MKPLSDLAQDWPALDRLLDEALALAPAHRQDWLAALAPEHAPLRDTLARLLTAQAGIETGDFMGTLARLDAPGGRADAGAPAAGDNVGPWRLVREIGVGGMGSVWLAERADGSLKRQVALKLPRLSWARGLAERMARERDILATLEHPHIARLYDAGLDSLGRPWLALEYVPGRPIDAYCRDQALPMRQRVALLLQVCASVAYAHSRLVIHRDLKPANILVTDDGQVKLLDFGIAKLMQGEQAQATALTAVGGLALTLDYASPEQVRGESLTTASDVYSLGVVAYELLTGAKPYRLKRGSAAELEEAIENTEVRPASATAVDFAARKALKGDLDAVLQRALQKTAAERYPTIAALADDLARHLAGEAVGARPDGLGRRLQRLAQRHRWPLGAAAVTLAAFGLAVGVGATALVVLALLLGLALALWQAREARRQAREARRESARAVAVQNFLLDIFRTNTDQQASPQQARAMSARDLLDRGAERLDAALADWPDARAQVLEVLGEMYYQLNEHLRAAELDRRRVSLLRHLLAPDDPQLAEALINLGSSLHATPWRDDILPALQDAQRILDARGDRDSELRGRLLSGLAQRHQNLSTPKMLAYATEAVAVLQALPQVNLEMLSTALHLLARAHVLQGQAVQADAVYGRALQAQLRMQAPSHVALAQTRTARGEALIAQGRFCDAAALLEPAYAEARSALGASDPGVWVVASRLAHALHGAGQREQALALHAHAVGQALAALGETDTMMVGITRMDRARSLFAQGTVEAALGLVEQVNAINRRHYDGSVVLAGGLTLQAMLLTALGDFAQAQALFEEGESHWHRGTAGSTAGWLMNRLWLERARLALAMAPQSPAARDAAQALLERVVPVPATAMSLPNDEVERDLLRAQSRAMAGDAAGAWALARAASERIASTGMATQRPAWRAQADQALAEALLGTGNAAEAQAPAQAAAQWRQVHDDPASPWTAAAEVVWAQVLFALGRPDEALALVELATQRLSQHQRLGPQFIEPARGLLAALKPRLP